LDFGFEEREVKHKVVELLFDHHIYHHAEKYTRTVGVTCMW